MILRLLVPAVDHPGTDTPFAWSLADARGQALREATTPLAGAPRADSVEAILPASRVLFARLKLPKVNAATIRELLPFAVEDRLVADPAQIHAVPGATNARGETLVAVVDRTWLAEAIAALSGAGLPPARALCESALLAAEPGCWHAVLGAERSFLVEDDGHAVAFDRPTGAEPPLAVRIASDEAGERGMRPGRLRVLVEPGLAPPDAALWSERTGMKVTVAESRPPLAAPVAATAIDLLAGDFARRSAATRGASPAEACLGARGDDRRPAVRAHDRRRVARRARAPFARGAARGDLPGRVPGSEDDRGPGPADAPQPRRPATCPGPRLLERFPGARHGGGEERPVPGTAAHLCRRTSRDRPRSARPVNSPAFWTARSPRERAVLAAIGALAVALLLFSLVWLPLERNRTRIAVQLPQLRASVAEMRAQAAEVTALRASPAREAGSTPALATLVASGALVQGLPGARLAALDGKRLKLALDDASWTSLVEWLSAAQSLHGLTVEEATVEALAAAGRVKAEFVLAAP